jgi:hypothetical protein
MRTLLLSTLASLLALAGGTARADGFVYQLPGDGWWVKYHMEGTSERNGMQVSTTGSLTLSSVGRTQENGVDCRWIEIERKVQRNDTEFTIVTKLLIPEKYLKKGQSPLDHVVRGWVQFRDNEPREIDTSSGIGSSALYLAGPLNEAKKLAKEEVDSKLGRLACEGVSGKTEYMGRFGTTRATVQLRLNEKAPFGVVQARVDSETERDGQVRKSTATYKLADVGTGATSALPGSQ